MGVVHVNVALEFSTPTFIIPAQQSHLGGCNAFEYFLVRRRCIDDDDGTIHASEDLSTVMSLGRGLVETSTRSITCIAIWRMRGMLHVRQSMSKLWRRRGDVRILNNNSIICG